MALVKTEILVDDIELSDKAEQRLQITLHDLGGLLDAPYMDISVLIADTGMMAYEIDAEQFNRRPRVLFKPTEWRFKKDFASA